MEKVKIEMAKAEKQKEVELAKIEKEIKLKELELTQRNSENNQNSVADNSGFDISKNARLVPVFQEKDVDQFFTHVEKIAQSMEWPEDKFAILLQSVLVGKARDVYTSLSIEQCSDYNLVKKSILQVYDLVPEAYRQKFRNLCKKENQSFVEFAREKEQFFTRWCESKEINENFEKLRQLILVEDFRDCIPSDIRMYLEDRQVHS